MRLVLPTSMPTKVSSMRPRGLLFEVAPEEPPRRGHRKVPAFPDPAVRVKRPVRRGHQGHRGHRAHSQGPAFGRGAVAAAADRVRRVLTGTCDQAWL